VCKTKPSTPNEKADGKINYGIEKHPGSSTSSKEDREVWTKWREKLEHGRLTTGPIGERALKYTTFNLT